MKSEPSTDTPTSFASETARFRAILAKGRSANQVALFDFLVERSMDQRSPKEVEIALALFGNDATLDASTDSGVRVYVHRLRKRIDDFYAGKSGLHLAIPKGEYRIVLEEVEQPTRRPTMATRFVRRFLANPALSVGLLLIVLAGLGFASWQTWPAQGPGLSGTAKERQALFGATSGQSAPLIAVGDNLLLAETQDQRSIQRMILNPKIQTRDDFGRFLKANPETFYQLYDFNLMFAPVGAVETAWKVQAELATAGGSKGSAVVMQPVSALSSEDLRSHDVIFVGRLAQLGILKQYVFAQSRLRLAAYNRLVDDGSGKSFEGQVYAGEQSDTRPDYGYLAILTGPAGHKLIVISGFGDRGTAAMAELLNAPRELSALKSKLGPSRHFEAVFEVQTIDGHAPQRRLVALHKLQ